MTHHLHIPTHANPGDAMSTDERYFDELATELMALNVTGAAAGDAVTQVRSHCRDSGETPDDAFGPAKAYARTLAPDLPHIPRQTLLGRLGRALGTTGLFLLGVGVSALLRGSSVELTPLLASLLLASIIAPSLIEEHLGFFLSRWWALAGLFSLGSVIAVGIALIPTFDPGLRLGGAPALVMAGICVAAATVLTRMTTSLDPFRPPSSQPSRRRWTHLALYPWLIMAPLAAGAGYLMFLVQGMLS